MKHTIKLTDAVSSILLEKIAKLEFKIGELKSENDELKHRVKMDEPVKTQRRGWTKEEYIANLLEKHSKVKKDCDHWQEKYFSLLALNQSK